MLGGFVVYATWAAFQNAHYEYGPYLSPFYAPVVWGDSAHAWFGPKPAWWPALLPFSPALIILPFPGLFRFTCYYYRGAYYKGFWADPPSCAVGEPRGTSYWGERWLPLVLQNVHRYFAYIAVIFLLSSRLRRVARAVVHERGDGRQGVRHRHRHARAGGQRGAAQQLYARLSLDPACRRRLQGRSVEVADASGLLQLLERAQLPHQLFAWCSLFSVAFADVYVRLCSMGILHDVRII